MKKLIIDLQTGERTERDFSDKEVLNGEKSVKEFQAMQLAKAEARSAAEAKLLALGLTTEDLKALLG